MAVDSTSVPPRSKFGLRGIAEEPVNPIGRKSWRKPKSSAKDSGDSKRSAAMTLVAIGAGAFGIWAFANAGSGKDAHGKIYDSPQACARDGAIATQRCQALWAESLRLHANHAPTYTTKAKCEEIHGVNKCGLASGARDAARHNLFIPHMVAYTMGRLTFGGYQAAPLFKRKSDGPMQYRMSAAPQPVTDHQGRRVSAFIWMSRASANASSASSRSLFAKKGSARAASRGGFGKSARAVSARG
ncbi:MAG: DUF1190 domain-containing protein [Hyphomicrobiales bacterium]|nr:DUF1190 domain-containing protein [Hyphomicrobiales bacterium]